MLFHGHFTNAMPCFVHVLFGAARSLKFPEAGGGSVIFGHLVWGNRRARVCGGIIQWFSQALMIEWASQSPTFSLFLW